MSASIHADTQKAMAPSKMEPSESTLLNQIASYHSMKIAKNPIYNFLLSSVVFTHCEPGLVIAHLDLKPEHMNSAGSLHGSVSATVADWMGGQAICSTFTAEQHAQRQGGTGVSVEIAVTYVGTIKVGETLEIEGRAERVGSNLAFTSVNLYRVEDGKRGRTVALGKHTKFVQQRR